MTKLKFVVDENLPQHLAYWIRDQGHDATHVAFEGLEKRPDQDVWNWAAANEAIIISKDQDFLNRFQLGMHPRLLWIRWGNTRKQYLMKKIAALWPDITSSFEEGEWLVELTKNDLSATNQR